MVLPLLCGHTRDVPTMVEPSLTWTLYTFTTPLLGRPHVTVNPPVAAAAVAVATTLVGGAASVRAGNAAAEIRRTSSAPAAIDDALADGFASLNGW